MPEFLIQLRRTYRATRVRLDAQLLATGLTTPQYVVLWVLEQEGELSSSALARQSRVTARKSESSSRLYEPLFPSNQSTIRKSP